MRKRQKSQDAEQGQRFTDLQSGRWIESELAQCKFQDARHGQRLRKLLKQLSEEIGGSIPWACQDWANTKAAYRLFSNDRVSEAEILGGHFQATQERIAARDVLILMLQDTTEFTFRRHDAAPIGIVHKSYTRKDKEGRPQHHTVCGLLMHSSLAVTAEGLPLGLAAIKFWTRDEFKGCNALKKKINPTRIPIEQKESYRWLENLRQSTALINDPQRCIHIGDRESDIYELFCAAQEAGTHFLVCTFVDRLAGDGNGTIADEMKQVRVQGLHRLQVRNKRGEWYWRSSTNLVSRSFSCRASQARISSILLRTIKARRRFSLGGIGGYLVRKFVKQTKINSWLANKRGLHQMALVEAEPEEGTGGTRGLGEANAALWQEQSRLDPAHRVIDQGRKVFPLLIRDGSPQILDFDRALAHEDDLGDVIDPSYPRITNQLRIQGHDAVRLVWITGGAGLPLQYTRCAVQFFDSIDDGDKAVARRQRARESDLLMATWPVNLDAPVLGEALEQLNALPEHAVPGVVSRVGQL